MPHTAKTRHALIYVLIAALVAPIVLLRGRPRAPEPADEGIVRKPVGLTISDVRITDVSETAATVTWHTNLPADSQATYGKFTPFEMGSERTKVFSRNHRVTLRNLESGETYVVCLVSESPEAGIATKEDVSLRTLGVAGFRKGTDMATYAALRDLASKATSVSPRDYDGDGDLDLLVCAENRKGTRLFRNDHGTFAPTDNKAAIVSRARSAAWADYDADGDLDLVMSSSWKLNLFESAGPPTWAFAEKADLLPRQRSYSAEGIAWLDYNRDGRPDVLVANGAYGLLLFRNTGKAKPRFEDVSDAAGLGRKGIGVGLSDFPAVADLDKDGYPDLLYNLRGRRVLVARNMGGKKFERIKDSGIDFTSRQRIAFALGDYDNDGDLDVFVPMSNGNKLYRNDGKFHFTDVTAKTGALKVSERGCTAAWGDVDNDGDLDLYVGRWYSSDRLYSNNGDGTFEDKTKSFRIIQDEAATARGLAFFDVEGDGDLDLFVSNLRGPNVFYINQAVITGQCQYLRVELGPKTRPLNAKIELRTVAGKLVGYREVCRTEGWGNQLPAVAHFGCPPGQYTVQITFTNKRVEKRTIKTTAAGPNVLRIE